jgi:D-glycero-alpha-D-manno-heptose-7-phosphate kinase
MKMTRTPLRTSFFGGGTDYPEHFTRHGGAVLASAVDKFSYITASRFPSRLFDYNIRVSYRKVELVKQVAEIEHKVYRACLDFCGLERDIELHNVADLPSFTGLGSSSTFTVGLLHALHSFKEESRTPMELAYEAIHIEQDILKENVGCQDQTLAAVGGFNLVEFRATDDIRVTPLDLPPGRLAELEDHLFVVFTGVTRRASDVVASQLAKLDQNRDTLTAMRLMVDEAVAILTGPGPLTAFGELLHVAWQAKRSLCNRISNSHIDEMYETAMQHGALGGKLLGAGGGGFLLLFVPPERHQELAGRFSDYEIISVRLNAPGSQVVFDPS